MTNDANDVYIGIDLGGTNIRAARFASDLKMQPYKNDEQGKPLYVAKTETYPVQKDQEGKSLEVIIKDIAEKGPEPVIERIVNLTKTVWPTDGTQVVAVGVSAPGPIDIKRDVITTPPNLPGWHDVPLRRILSEKLGVPVYVGNDANLAALAEYEMGAGRGYQNVIYLTISTGIGSGVIIEGHPLLGSRGMGAECGHLMVVEGGEPIRLEEVAAGPAIAEYTIRALKQGEKSAILDMVNGDLEKVEARTVGEAANAGDPLAVRMIARAGRLIGLGVVSLLHVFNPEIVIIGGSVAEGTRDLLFDPIWEMVRKYRLDPAYLDGLKIVLPTLGADVSVIGAAASARRKGQ
jgi:glucokinase